jgi:hypothetical protein
MLEFATHNRNRVVELIDTEIGYEQLMDTPVDTRQEILDFAGLASRAARSNNRRLRGRFRPRSVGDHGLGRTLPRCATSTAGSTTH